MEKVEKIIELLKEIKVDGDIMNYIIRQVVLEEQILKQLVLSSDELPLKNALEEREAFNNEDSLKDIWRNVYNREYELESVAKKVWEDIYNNDTLYANTFEDYWRDLKVKL
jgi:hypothetical protein